MEVVSAAPLGLFADDFLVIKLAINGQILVFPSGYCFLYESYTGFAVAARNITPETNLLLSADIYSNLRG